MLAKNRGSELINADRSPSGVSLIRGNFCWAFKRAKTGVPVELHLYATGGHGYGLRRTSEPVTTWSDRAAEWLRSRGLLEARPVGARLK